VSDAGERHGKFCHLGHTTVKNPDLFLSQTGNSANASRPKVAMTTS
jgi:hypothetical protein